MRAVAGRPAAPNRNYELKKKLQAFIEFTFVLSPLFKFFERKIPIFQITRFAAGAAALTQSYLLVCAGRNDQAEG